MTTEAGQVLTQEEALIRAICQNPKDDDPRLRYADWLDENAQDLLACFNCGTHRHPGRAGQVIHGVLHESDPRVPHHHHDEKCPQQSDGRRERAEFIRVQCEIARRHCPWCEGKGTLLGSAGDKGNPECDCGVLALRRREGELWPHVVPTFDVPADWIVDVHRRGTDRSAVVRRGFIDEARLPIAAFVGGPCGRCEGTGRLRYYCPREIEGIDDCPDCKGTSRVEGLARKLFESHPATRVVIPGLRMVALGGSITVMYPDNCDWDEFGTFVQNEVLRYMARGHDITIPVEDVFSAAAVAYGRSEVDWLRAYDERKVAACRRGTTGG